MGNMLPLHTLPTAKLTGASKARIVMFRSAASRDGSASKYELKPRSVGAFFCPHHLSAPSRRCQHLRQRRGAGASASREAGNSCVGWLCIQARSWSRVLKRAPKFSGPQTEVIEVIVGSPHRPRADLLSNYLSQRFIDPVLPAR